LLSFKAVGGRIRRKKRETKRKGSEAQSLQMLEKEKSFGKNEEEEEDSRGRSWRDGVKSMSRRTIGEKRDLLGNFKHNTPETSDVIGERKRRKRLAEGRRKEKTLWILPLGSTAGKGNIGKGRGLQKTAICPRRWKLGGEGIKS